MLLNVLPYVLAVAAALCVVGAWLGRRRRAVLVLCGGCAVVSACSAAITTPGSPLSLGTSKPAEFRGGIRLIYTVEVGEAIKDRRDRYHDTIRAGLADAFGLHRGDAAPTRKELQQLGPKLRLEKLRDPPGALAVVFVDPADSAKIDEAFVQRFAQDLEVQRSADQKTVSLRVRKDVEAMIRARAVAQVKDTVQRRLEAIGLGGKGLFTRSRKAVVTARGEELVVELPGVDERELWQIKEIIGQTGRLEFKMVDDDVDFFEPLAAKGQTEDLPRGMAFALEHAPVGPERTRPVHYARIVRVGDESMRESLHRLREWAATLQVDSDHEIGFGKLLEYDGDRGATEEIGWRTYYLFSKAELSGDSIRDAAAREDRERGMGWFVALEFTPVGGERFAEITGNSIRRRFAISLDGRVESAPVIQSRIVGGHAQITMGMAAPDQQGEEALRLALVLRSGALAAPLTLMTEELVPP
jgi:preprotein translocase subunit SecD